MKTVYVVLEGDDCEGAYIQAVFAKKEDAIKHLDKNYPTWIKTAPDERYSSYFYNGKIRRGCTSAFVEEWEIK